MKQSSRINSILIWAGLFAVAIVLVRVVGGPSAAQAATVASPHLHALLAGGFALTSAVLPVFDKVEDIPEPFRAVYEAKDGKFVPTKVVSADELTGLKGKNADLLTRLTAAQKRAALLGDRTPEDIQSDLELAAKFKEDKAKAEGDFKTLKEQLLAQHSKELEKIGGRGKKLESKLYDVMARREAEAAIVAAGGNPKVLLPHILPFVKPIESDDDWTVKVVDGKGNVRISDSQGAEMTIAQLVEQFKADETFGVAFKPSGASGSGARNTGGGGGGGSVVLIPKDASTQEYRRLKEDAEKRGVPYKIAS